MPPQNHPQPTQISASYINDVILPEFHERKLVPKDYLVRGPLYKRPQSQIFKAVFKGHPFPVAVKVFEPGKGNAYIAEKQFSILEKYHSVIDEGQGFSIPRPVGYIPRHRTILMEWMEMPTLGTSMSKFGLINPFHKRYLGLAAQWLRWFHNLSDIENKPFNSNHYIVKLDQRIAGLPKQVQGVVNDELFQRCYRLIQSSTSEFERMSIDHAVVHGDFKPDNLFYSQRRVVGFDFSDPGMRPITEDICRFLLNIEIGRFPGSGGMKRGINPQFFSDLELFRGSYGLTRKELPDDFVVYLMLIEILYLWQGMLIREMQQGTSWWRQQRLKRVLWMAEYFSEKVLPSGKS